MAQNIFIGIDGGGTKCKIRVEDEAGNVFGQAMSGPANIRFSPEIAWQSIYTALNEILTSRKLSLEDPYYHFHVGLGLAGCEVKEAKDTFLTHHHPFTTLQLTTDAHIACLGAHQGKDGAMISIGTGIVGFQIQGEKQVKVGGWGFPHDDEGSGAWLGLEAIRLTCQWLDHRSDKSPLVEDVFSFFNHDINHLISWADRATANEFARLAPLVINHSQQEEIAAVRLIKKAAHAVEKISHAMTKLSMDKNSLPCALFGGIAPFIEPWLNEEVKIHLVPRLGDATEGAIRMIREYIKMTASGKVLC